MWGDNIRPGPDGRGVPAIRRELVTAVWAAEDGTYAQESYVGWYVTYPDTSFGNHFVCCGRTTSRGFDTWSEALAFAVGRRWEK
jgi:hypothetical protein